MEEIICVEKKIETKIKASKVYEMIPSKLQRSTDYILLKYQNRGMMTINIRTFILGLTSKSCNLQTCLSISKHHIDIDFII